MGKELLITVVNAILLFTQITNTSAVIYPGESQPLNRLLTPEEGCGVSKVANTKIVGGAPAKNGAYPWMVLIGQKKLNVYGYPFEIFGCDGSLITSRHVLTAAHCAPSYDIFVRLGEYDITTMTDGVHQDMKVIRKVKHPNYNKEFQYSNDIAILTLEHHVKFNDRIQPICLPLADEVQRRSFVNSNAFVAGWGKMEKKVTCFDGGPMSDVLMEVQLPVLNNTQCEALYKAQGMKPKPNEFGDSIICASNLAGGQGACTGDSGGPLMLPILHNGTFPMYEIALVSNQVGCALPNWPGIYTNVPYFMDWIKMELSKQQNA